MKLFSNLYDRVLGWARHRHATWYLGALSFTESSFFPIPPDVMLMPMVLARRAHAWRYALLTTVASVAGGVLGYFIGEFFFIQIGQPLIDFYHAAEKYEKVHDWFAVYGIWIVFLAGFTPLPYKFFTISAGAAGMALLPFMLASAVGRGARFFLVAGLIYAGGEKFERSLRERIDLIGWLMVALVVVGLITWRLLS